MQGFDAIYEILFSVLADVFCLESFVLEARSHSCRITDSDSQHSAGLLQWFCSGRLGPENPGSSPTVNHCVCLVVLVASDWLPLPARGESIRGVWGTGSGPSPPAAAGQWFDGDQGCGAMMGSGLKSTVPHLSWHCCRVGLDACGSEGSTTLVIGGGLVCVCHL